MRTQHSSEIVAAIRAKLADHRLPLARPSQMWAGDGSGEPCDACDQPIPRDDVEYEAQFLPGGTFRFHRKCFDTWHQERAAHMQPPRA